MTLYPAPTLYPGETVYPGGSVAPQNEFTPTVEGVARILQSRTREAGTGRLLGTFTDLTDPTADQVAEIILDADREVASAVPESLPDAPGNDPDALRKARRRVVELLAAAGVELTYPSTRGGLDKYDRLYKRFTDALARLLEAVEEASQGGDGLSALSEAVGPSYSFDELYTDVISGACSSHIPGTEQPLPESWC
jgi:hypothetical protein